MDNEHPAMDDSINDDVYECSIQALRPRTRNLISALLNPPKIFLSDSGLSRDWHGLAELVGIGGERVPHLQCGGDPSGKVLTLWLKEYKEDATVKNLMNYLEQLDRFDIIDDIKSAVDEDVNIFEQNKNQTNTVCLENPPEYFLLTNDDLKRYEQGLGPQQYDAFILFADEDIGFATELIENLEKNYKLKVCVKDRDLLPGVFEHESIIKLIAERCNRLVAIFSPTFFQTSSNKFFLSFAQSLGIEQRRRKIIPCSNTFCKAPPEYGCYFTLHRGRNDFNNFWERLRNSIKEPQVNSTLQNQTLYRSASQKISPVTLNNDTQPCLEQKFVSNTLKPKSNNCVKFNSMSNLKYLENDGIQISSQPLKPNNCDENLTNNNLDSKKRKSKLSWFKKILPRKTSKYNNNCQRKVALVN